MMNHGVSETSTSTPRTAQPHVLPVVPTHSQHVKTTSSLPNHGTPTYPQQLMAGPSVEMPSPTKPTQFVLESTSSVATVCSVRDPKSPKPLRTFQYITD